MSRVFLVSFNTCDHPSEVYPLGVSVIASALMRAGHDVRLYDRLIDGCNDDDLLEAIKQYRSNFIGISLRNLDDNIDSSWLTSNRAVFLKIGELIKRIKAICPVPIIVGGTAFSLMPELLIDLIGADYGIIGEGEWACCHLIDALQRKKLCSRIIRGFDYYKNDESIQGAFYDSHLISEYYKRSDFAGIQTKRGCPFHCAYCVYPLLEGNNFRHRDIRDVIEEIKLLRAKYACENIYFTDSVFNDPAGQFMELVEAMAAAGLNIHWTAYFTPYGIKKNDIELCRKTGLLAVEMGTDASNSSALAGLGKNFDWDDVLAAHQIITGAGIDLAHHVIFGGPGETYATVEEGISNCMQLEECVVLASTGIRIYPNTPIHTRALGEGYISENTCLLEPTYYFSAAIEKHLLDQMISRAWRKNKHLVFPPENARMICQSLKSLCGAKGLLWNQICRR